MAEVKIRVDPEFRDLIPPLSEHELAQLTDNLKREGCRDPLVVWSQDGRETVVIVDGHHRYAICKHEGIGYRVKKIRFTDREAVADWIDANQLGRRNLSPDQASLLRGRRYNRVKLQVGRPDKCGQNDHINAGRTSEKLAKQHGVSAKTIRRDGQFTEAVEKLKVLDPTLEKAIVSGKGPPRTNVIKAAELLERNPDESSLVLSGDKTVARAVKDIQKSEKEAQDRKAAASASRAIKSGDASGVYHGDSFELAKSIPDESCALIFTDPPYNRKSLSSYWDLGYLASRILIPGGSLITYARLQRNLYASRPN